MNQNTDTMQVLVVEPGKEPYEKEISTGLASLQKEVGGYIEAVYPFEEPVAIICNEEGKLNGAPLNRMLRDEFGEPYDILAGTFLVVGLGDDDFCSLKPELMEAFKSKFETPEQFYRVEDTLYVVPMEERGSLARKLQDLAKEAKGKDVKKQMKKSTPEEAR